MIKIKKKHALYLLALSFFTYFILCYTSCNVNPTGNDSNNGNSNAKLKNIFFTENIIIDQEFNHSTTNYNLSVLNNIHSFKVIATADDSAATIKLDNINIPSGGKSYNIYVNDLEVSETKDMHLKVIAENGESTKSYIFTIKKLAPAPELILNYKGYPIYNNTQNYPLGTVLINSDNYFSFVIKNSGSETLDLSGDPIIDLTGDNSFSVYLDVSKNNLLPAETIDFQILYNPVTEGAHNCSIVITNNDPTSNPHTISLQGISTSSPSEVTDLILDNFDNNILDSIMWAKEGSSHPFIQNVEKTEGSSALEFGNVEYNEKSSIKTIIDVLTPSTLSFYYKTYTGDSDNKFQFYINNALIDSWTYSNNWTEYTYPLTTGKNILEWRYYNGDNYRVGSNYTAWIDYIYLETGNYKLAEQDICITLGNDEINNGDDNVFNGITQLGYYKDTLFTITNNGCNQLMLSGNPKVSIINDIDNVFSLEEDADEIISVGQSTRFTINFTPDQKKQYSATIEIQSNDKNDPLFSFEISADCTNDLKLLDNFDSGNLNNFPWVLGGEELPFVQSDFYNNGGYSLEIGNVDYLEESYCQTVITVLEPSILQFYYRVNNNSNSSNTFRFFIDENQELSSSYKDWTKVTYNLNAGLHKLKWQYKAKSTSYIGSAYGAWIDDVKLITGSYMIADQEINIKNKNNDISNGSNDFDIGNVFPNSTYDIIFEIENQGGLPLMLTGNPNKIQFSGDPEFSIKTNPVDNINGGEKSSFVISFTPSSENSNYTTTLTIPNNDSDESNYIFTINGYGSSILSRIDDFESGNLTCHPWNITTTSVPLVQDNTKYAENFALAFGDLSYQQEQIIKTKIDILTASTLSFYLKTNTHTSYNKLEFYVDDVLQLTKTYNNDWTEYTYALTPGSHELKWRYYQGSSSYQNQYLAWIDEIMLKTGNYTYGNQEIKLYYNDNEITNGQTNIPTNYISINQTKNIIFTIKNDGSKNLELTNTPNRISLSGDNIFDLSQDADSIILPYSTGQFIISAYTDTSGDFTGVVSILNNDSTGSPFTFSFNGTAGSFLIDFDDFESGTLTSYPWTLDGDAPPFVQNTEVYEGNSTLQFGDINDNQESIIQTTIDVLEESELSFYYKIEAETSCDYLIFYDDATMVMSGKNTSWTEYIYTLSPGIHTLKWRYKKDGSVSSGADTAWVDNIKLTSGSFTPQ